MLERIDPVNSRELPRIKLPSPEEDRPTWGRVGIVAVLGLLIGVAWPRFAGISLGPNPPSDAPRAVVSTVPPAKTVLSAVSSAVPGVQSTGSAVLSPTVHEQGISLGEAEFSRCRDLKGKAVDTCDSIAIGPLFEPRLKELSRCPSALGLFGKVSLSFDLDFKNKTLKVQRAKSKLPRTTLDGLTRCVERSFNSISLDEIEHAHNRYTISYEASFLPPGAQSAETVAPKGVPLENKTGKVTWGSCQVREAPSKTASAIGKLPRKTEIKLLEEKDGWYRIEYKGNPQAWVFGAAITTD